MLGSLLYNVSPYVRRMAGKGGFCGDGSRRASAWYLRLIVKGRSCE